MVSSRDEEEVLKYVKELNLNNYHIVEGARLIDTKGKEIWHRYLSPSKTKEILNLLKPCNLEIVVFADGKVCKDNFEKLKKVTLIILQHFLWSEALKWEKFLKRIKGVSVLIVHSTSIPNVWNVLVSHKHGTKRHAAKKLQVLLGVKKSETIAVGDGHNDLDMFKQAGLKVAMGNAVHELKKEADYIAPSVDRDGLVMVFEKFV